MENKKYTVIEVVADYIYFVITGSFNSINKFIDNISSNKKLVDRKFIPVRIDVPLAFSTDKLEKMHNIKIIIEEGAESAQSFAFARHSFIYNKTNSQEDFFNGSTYMLVELEILDNNNEDYYKLKFPKLELQDDDDPEEVLLKWVKHNGCKVSSNMKKTIKPITLVGCNEDILVYTAKI